MEKGSVWGVSRFAVAIRVFALVCVVAGSSVAADPGAEGDASPDAAVSCSTSASCGYPTPYCSSTFHTCVECTNDKNCGDGLVCDVAQGVCRHCNDDADCSSVQPYCDPGSRSCVECLTDANCGPAGEKCANGVCGSCGDGICGRRERIQGFSTPGSTDVVGCQKDCLQLCPTYDLKSALGDDLVSGTFAGRQPLFDVCYLGGGLGEISVRWKAPHAGVFFLSSKGTPLLVTEWAGDCSTVGMSGCSSLAQGSPAGFQLAKGDEVMIVLSPMDDPLGMYSLSISDKPPSCDGGCAINVIGSPPPPPGAMSDGGVVTSASQAMCLANARARHDEICAGTECACAHCPQNYDDCRVIPGCDSVSACMTQKGCVGTDCYISGACRTSIDTYGGLAGPAFRAASGLQSCALSLDCDLPCSSDGGTSKDAGSLDAGPACAPGRSVECPCEGGVTGKKTCLSDGSGFQACVCGEPPLSPVSSGGCNCRVSEGTAGSPARGALAVLGAVLALCSRRRRVRHRPEGEGT